MKHDHHFSRIGQNIKDAYMDKKHKQADFAELVGLELRTLQNYVNGHSQPTFECVKKIATALEMTVDELETYHERPVTNINKPKNNHIVVNHGTVQSDDWAVKELLTDIKAHLLRLEKRIEDLEGKRS